VRGLLFALALAACATGNERILRDLAQGTVSRADYEALARREPGPAPLAGPAAAATLPLTQGRIPAVLGRINGVTLPLVLDTGTSHVMLSGPAARATRAYVARRDPVPIVYPGYQAAHKVCVLDSLEIGDTRFGPVVATVPMRETDHHRWANLGSDAYAIVGCAVLSHFRVTFDFRGREVRLAPTGRPASTRLVTATVEINGRPLSLLVDSGATDLILEPWAARDLGLMNDYRLKDHDERAERADEVVYSRLDPVRVRVAGRTFEEIPALAVRTFGPEVQEEGLVAGLFGLQAFGRMVWTLDYGRRLLEPE